MKTDKKKETVKKRKNILGVVVSDKMDKTVVMEITTHFLLPGIGKVIKKSKKVKVHDEKGVAKVGDKILAYQTRPISRSKHYNLLKVIEKAK
jgi:small subunit ribosomal protein S17